MSISLWKMCLDKNTLPCILEPGMRKKTRARDCGNVGYVPLPREQSPQTPYKKPCNQTMMGTPTTDDTQELWTNGTPLDPW